MRKILVTGASGWLGSAIVKALLERGDAVVATDIVINAATQALAAEHPRLTAMAADLCEWPTILGMFSEHRPDAVVHAAAIVGVIFCADIPIKANRVNVEGSINVFEAMRLSGVKRVIHVSTEETYGDFTSPLITEDHPQNPISVYGATKLAVEHYGRMYSRNHGLECINVRTCWVYGPHLPRLREPRTFIEAALRNEAFHMESGADLAVDQVYISDTVAGLLLALDKPQHRFEAYNVATGVAPTIGDAAKAVCAAIPGARITVGAAPYRYRGGIAIAAKGALDIRRAREELGYAPKYTLQQGIALTIDATREAMRGTNVA